MRTDLSALIEHAARLLERTPARCMPADALHERACRETGLDVSLPGLLHALSARPDRFALVHAHPGAGQNAGWAEADLAAYAPGAAASGGDFLVMLAEPPAADPYRGVPWPGTERLSGSAELLAEVHDALTRVLRAAADDEALFRATSAAVQELDAVQRELAGAGMRQPLHPGSGA
ncbi:MAG: hypothetical protein WD054_07115 [Gemmatimonadota bacterium]